MLKFVSGVHVNAWDRALHNNPPIQYLIRHLNSELRLSKLYRRATLVSLDGAGAVRIQAVKA